MSPDRLLGTLAFSYLLQSYFWTVLLFTISLRARTWQKHFDVHLSLTQLGVAWDSHCTLPLFSVSFLVRGDDPTCGAYCVLISFSRAGRETGFSGMSGVCVSVLGGLCC